MLAIEHYYWGWLRLIPASIFQHFQESYRDGEEDFDVGAEGSDDVDVPVGVHQQPGAQRRHGLLSLRLLRLQGGADAIQRWVDSQLNNLN